MNLEELKKVGERLEKSKPSIVNMGVLFEDVKFFVSESVKVFEFLIEEVQNGKEKK